MASMKARRVLVFGWGAAAEAVLREIAAYTGTAAAATVLCISHTSQAGDCNLQDVCRELSMSCTLSDDDAAILALSSEFAPELIVSASYRRRLPNAVLELCLDCINFHPSLLPKHRGCWSGFWAIFEGDEETGVTCHRMVEAFDSGAILHQERLSILSIDTSASLYRRLLPVTADCARHVMQLFFGSNGLPAGHEQVGTASYHFRKLPFQGIIQSEWTDEQVERFIRAMHFPPYDGAAMLVNGEKVFVDSLQDVCRIRRESELAAALPAAAVAAAAVAAAPPATAAAVA